MTDSITLTHFVAGHPISGPATLTHNNPADPADFRVDIPEAGADEIHAAINAARAAVDVMRTRGVEARRGASWASVSPPPGPASWSRSIMRRWVSSG
jgi:hypothetical protein